MGIVIDLKKAKIIGHDIRRAARAEEFKPYDEAIAKQIPGQMEDAEAARQLIRDKYVTIQTSIDVAATPNDIKTALGI